MPGVTEPAADPRSLWTAVTDDHVSGLAWSPDDQCLAVATSAGTISLHDAATGNTIREIAAHATGPVLVRWSFGGLASGGQDGKVLLWNSATGERAVTLDPGAAWVDHLAWSPDGALLASAAGKILRVWNAAGELQAEHADFPSTIAALCWRPDGKAVGAGCYGGVRLFRIGESQPYEDLAWKGSILSLAWSPNARYVAGGSQEATINFWKLPFRDGEQLHMSGYATKVRELAWDKDSRFLATGGGEIITVWDVSGKGPAGTRPLQLESHGRNVTHLLYQAHGPLLASGDSEGHVALWQPAKLLQPIREGSLSGAISSAAWSHDDEKIAWGSDIGEISLWSTTD